MPDEESRHPPVVGRQAGADAVSAGKTQDANRQRPATSEDGCAVDAPRSRIATVAIGVSSMPNKIRQARLAVPVHKRNASGLKVIQPTIRKFRSPSQLPERAAKGGRKQAWEKISRYFRPQVFQDLRPILGRP